CVLNIDPRWLVLLHLTRLFAGAYFLVLCQRSQLPCAFATPAGSGDTRGVGYRSSLAGVTAPDTVICWRVLSGALSAQPIALRVRNTGGLGRHRYWCPGGGCGW